MAQPDIGNLAFVLGTRKGDPNCGDQQFFSPSSSWMPPFMRVNPILLWSYGEVWEFLRHYDLKYCYLYDEVISNLSSSFLFLSLKSQSFQGYTSLGKQADTEPNPSLKAEDGRYRPAYMLTDWSLERAGRSVKPIVSTSMDKTKATTENDRIISGDVTDGCEMKINDRRKK